MSEEQRQQHLARRCATYQESIGRGKQIDTSTTTLEDITNIPIIAAHQHSVSDTHINNGAGPSNRPNGDNMGRNPVYLCI
ncbi:hypothetical protein AHAS_Ahas20G0160600 [Arachis hypogaea]